MKTWWWFAAGLAAVAGVAQFAAWRGTRAVGAGLDLNTCSREDLRRLPGMRDDLADRVLDNRPYRSKFDLLNRRIIPDAVYSRLRSRVRVDKAVSHSTVQIA